MIGGFRAVIAGQLIVQNGVEQSPMHSNAAIVVNKAEFVEMVHEKTDTRPRCTDHLGQFVFRDLWNQPLKLIGLAKFRHQQEYPRQAFLAGVEELVEKIRLGLPGTKKKIFDEYLGEGALLVYHAEHLLSLNLQG